MNYGDVNQILNYTNWLVNLHIRNKYSILYLRGINGYYLFPMFSL